MKTENRPIKIDCFALRNFKGDVDPASKIHIGYILFPVKIIPIVPLVKAFQIQANPRWTKLIGLSKDWRVHKPELRLSIMITSKDFEPGDKADILESHGLETTDSIVIDENPPPSMLSSQKGFYIYCFKMIDYKIFCLSNGIIFIFFSFLGIFIRLLEEEGLVQVGNIDTNCDVFSVKVLMKSLRFLENVRFFFEDFMFQYFLQ